MTDPISLLVAKNEVCNSAHDAKAWLAYRMGHDLCSETLNQKVGGYVVRDIIECGNRRFEFAEGHQNKMQALVIGAFDELGEREIDFVAWSLIRPDQPMTLFGRCGLLGLDEAMNPATYYLGGVLQIHRTPIEWLKNDCRGAVVITPWIAAQQLVGVPGKILAQDEAHAAELQALMDGTVPKDKILVPSDDGGRPHE